MKRTTVLALLGGLLICAPLSAEQIYVRNRLFKGSVQGSGKSTKVGMKDFAAALGLSVAEQGGAFWLQATGDAAPEAGPDIVAGSVYILGKRVETEPGADGELMISLWEAAEAAGFRAQANPQLGSIDVNKMPSPGTGAATRPSGQTVAAAAPPAPVSGPMPPRRINTPGARVDVERALIPGRYNLVVFGADW